MRVCCNAVQAAHSRVCTPAHVPREKETNLAMDAHLVYTLVILFCSAPGISVLIMAQFLKPLLVLDLSVIVGVCLLHKGV
jgi:hypothetical protein